MKKNISLFVLFFLSFVLFPINAEWNKGQKKKFNNANEYLYIFDREGTRYYGMGSNSSCVAYQAARSGMNASDYELLMQNFGDVLRKCLIKETAKNFSENSKSECGLYIHLDEITDKAGMKVTVIPFFSDGKVDQGEKYYFKVEDGRWNTFYNLMEENAEVLAQKIAKKVGVRNKGYLYTKSDLDFDPIYE